MIEILKILIEFFLENFSIESLAKMKKEKKLNEIGTEIFLLYSNLNTILVQGREILVELEDAADWMRRKTENGEPERMYSSGISFILKQQLRSLEQFIEAYRRLETKLEVFTPAMKVKLVPILYGKYSALSDLKQSISPFDNEPSRLISIDEKKLRDSIAAIDTDSVRFQKNEDSPKWPILWEMSHAGKKRHSFIIDEGLHNMDEFKADTYPIIERFLESEKMKNNLDEIERYAIILKEIIERNFKIEDIILNVGDKRLK
ncbi:MAG: hypothetical protein ACQ5SW_02015 [Sphaerochaetaceae bacterium]